MNFLKALAAGLFTVGLLVSCGDSDDPSMAPTTTTSTSQATTSTTEDLETPTTTTSTSQAATSTTEDLETPTYEIERPMEFIGSQLDGPPEGYGTRTAWVSTDRSSQRAEAGIEGMPRVVHFGSMVLAGQLPFPGENKPYPLVVTDGVRLSSESAAVYLRIQCTRRVGAPTGVGPVALIWRRPDFGEVALELWDYDPGTSLLVEMNPDTYELGDCTTP